MLSGREAHSRTDEGEQTPLELRVQAGNHMLYSIADLVDPEILGLANSLHHALHLAHQSQEVHQATPQGSHLFSNLPHLLGVHLLQRLEYVPTMLKRSE